MEEISRLTHVRLSYLEALERGDLEGSLGSGYVKHLLVRYGNCLGLPTEELLQAYRESEPDTSTRGHAYTVHERADAANVSWGARFVLGGVAVCAVGIIAAAILMAITQSDPLAGAAEPTTGTVAAVPPPATTTTTTVAVVASASERPTTSASVSATTVSAGSFALRLTPRDRVWLELTDEASGQVLYRGIRQAGDSLVLEPTGPVRAVVGNPAVVSMKIDGRLLTPPRSTRWLVSSDGVVSR